MYDAFETFTCLKSFSLVVAIFPETFFWHIQTYKRGTLAKITASACSYSGLGFLPIGGLNIKMRSISMWMFALLISADFTLTFVNAAKLKNKLCVFMSAVGESSLFHPYSPCFLILLIYFCMQGGLSVLLLFPMPPGQHLPISSG